MAILPKQWSALLAVSLLSSFVLPATQAAYTPLNKSQPGTQTGSADDSMDEITVEADRETVRKSVIDFARHVTRKRDVNESIARWIDPLCPLVAGLPRAPADFMLDRISTIARGAGVKLDDTDCKPNFYVVVTAQPVAFLQAWRRRDGNLFGNAFPSIIDRFIGSARPISVWYNDQVVGSFDKTPSTVNVSGGSNGSYQGYKMTGSRVKYDTLLGIRSAIVIVDTTRTSGWEIHPVTDYVAMVGLMEINPDADLGRAPSVLRMFDVVERTVSAGGATSTHSTTANGLSPWDQAFLKALYKTDADSRSQVAQITDSMMTDLAH